MNMLECTAMLIAAENGLPVSDWPDFVEQARLSLRNVGLRNSEIVEDRPEVEQTLRDGLDLLRTSRGRKALIQLSDEFLIERGYRN